ncbi:MAG TPA: NADH-quinone oxidoreductase subunit N, partial [Tepidisphaeraceae bacterium]
MNSLFRLMIPEMILATVACFLFLLGVSRKPSSRSLAALIALLTLIVVFIWQLANPVSSAGMADDTNTIHLFSFGQYIKLLASGVGILLVLLAWPSNRDATGNAALNFGEESGEFFALMLLSITGVFLVAGANDIILLFLGIELASIPTYIMVSISRPLPVAQEAGVKYFFLGAMAAAIMLFGFSYLYGTTGLTKISEISALFHRSVGSVYPNNLPPILTTWQLLAVLMLLAGFAFKIAAVPLHFYAGDVYQGAATPVTAFLAFIPKTSGFVAIIKLLFMAGGGSFMLPETIIKTLWVIAALTMTVGNVLGLLQFNVKRVLAYSSIAHSGYMLVGLTALISATSAAVQTEALQGVLFYLAAYGIMNAGAFGVLTLLPARRAAVATSAETFEDLAGEGRKHPALGLAMAVCCFSLTGLPLTIGFFGKLFLIKPALDVGTRSMNWLVVITMV